MRRPPAVVGRRWSARAQSARAETAEAIAAASTSDQEQGASGKLMPLEAYQLAYHGKSSAGLKLEVALSSLTLAADDETHHDEIREQVVYERGYEAKRRLEGRLPAGGRFVNGVWTEDSPAERLGAFSARMSDTTSVVFAAARRRDDAVLKNWRRLASRLVLRDIYRTATTRTPQTPSKASRTDNTSPLGVDKFDPAGPIPDDACPVCLSSLSSGAVALPCWHKFHESCVRGVYAYQQACPLCCDTTPLMLTPRRRTDDAVYGKPVENWEPRHFRVTGTCLKCGESIYAGQHRVTGRSQYHNYRYPDAETNAVIRALAPEHDWINASAPPTFNPLSNVTRAS